jgi:hypothetical protein
VKRSLIFLIFSSLFMLNFQNPASADLYAFSAFTFSNCNQSGVSGPTLSQCTTAYSGNSWVSNSNFFNVSSGIQLWTVPISGNYVITSAGAGGGRSSYASGGGIINSANYVLTQGDVIKILVGQTGDTQTASAGGGGGGTFIYDSTTSTLLQVAGGGGGAGNFVAGSNANSSTGGVKPPHGSYGGTTTGGSLGAEPYTGGGGGGSNLNANGSNGASNGLGGSGGAGYGGNGGQGENWSGTVATSFLNGGGGGFRTSYGTQTAGFGGFGGGGPGSNFAYQAGGGGGGGYAGGGGGSGYQTGGGGGGGGSYLSGSSQYPNLGINYGFGYVNISISQSPTAFKISVTSATSKRAVTYITATITTPLSGGAGRITFYQNGRLISGCVNLLTISGSVNCGWKPITHGMVTLTAILSPTDSSYTGSSANPISVTVSPRSVSR